MYKTAPIPLRAFILGAATALLGWLAGSSSWVADREASLGLDWLFRLRGSRPAPDETIIVTMDRNSSERFGLPHRPERWSRVYHTRLVDKLSNARVITFDIHFNEARTATDDQQLAASIRKAGNVALFEFLDKKDIGSAIVEQRVPPIAELAEAAIASAPFPLPKVPKQVSQYWLFKRGAGDAPTLPVIAFHIYALPAYDDFLRMIRELSPQAAAQLPGSAATVRDDKSVVELARKLRILLQNDRTIARSLLDRLQHTATIDPQTRRLLTAWVNIHTGADIRYLDFYGPPRSIPMVSYHRALSDDFDGAGKAVFVGFLEERFQNRQIDGFDTVFSQDDGVELSGVEIAATIFNNLLENRSVTSLPALYHYGLLGIWGMTAGIVFLLLPPPRVLPAMALLVLAYAGLACYVFERNAVWLPLITPLLLQLPCAVLIALLLRYVERQNLRATLAYFLPGQIVEEAARGLKDIGSRGRSVHGVCLSSDASQYTALSESMDPEALHTLLNSYYQLLFQPVERHGGRVSDVIGDEMLALWDNAPAEDEVCRQACAAVFEIIAALKTPGDAESSTTRNARFPTRFGLHSGTLRLGNVGAGKHYEYRPVGDAVNTCTRIQGFNKQLGTQVLASQRVARNAHGIIAREVGCFRLAGKQQPQVLYELVRQGDELTAAEQDLYRRFALALCLFRDRHWAEAAVLFKGLAHNYNDRPSRYYVDLCSAYIIHPPARTWEGVVDVKNK